MFIVNAIVSVLFGLGFLFFPERVLALFGTTEKYASTLLMGRFFGTAMLALSLVLWFAKDITEESVQKGIGIALLVGAVAGLIVTLIGTFAANAVIRSNGWIAMVIYLLFGLGYVYLVFLKRESFTE
jgi:ABC-type spermidine/putrescine transport system permease subunit II